MNIRSLGQLQVFRICTREEMLMVADRVLVEDSNLGADRQRAQYIR